MRPRTSQSPTNSSAVLLSGAVACAIAAGCATSDYRRLHAKIDAYEARVAVRRTDLNQTSDPARKVRELVALINLTNQQIILANRVNPRTHPDVAAGTLSVDEARIEKERTIEKLEANRAEYIRRRDAISNSPPVAGH